MDATTTSNASLGLVSRLTLRGDIRFETGWRIGSGREGATCDLGVVLDPDGAPVLPGSSIKGRLRSTCESLAHALGLSACFLDQRASKIACASDIDYYSKVLRNDYKQLLERPDHTARQRLDWIDRNTCQVCKLFGSPVKASKLRCSDGRLEPGSWPRVVTLRDGVVLDRDSHTAVNGLKFDYEVIPPDTSFAILIDVENPTDAEIALLGAAIFEWHAGSSLGGFTSRGLGRFRLDGISVSGVDFTRPKERINYLTQPDPKRRLTDRGDWKVFFEGPIKRQIEVDNAAKMALPG